MSASEPKSSDSDIRDRNNPVIGKLEAGKVVTGLGVRLMRGPEVARIALGSGFDYLYIDSQHAAMSIDTINCITQTALALGIAPFVRTRGSSDPNLSVLLDIGVAGLVIPDVESVSEAESVIEAVKFEPIGARSLGAGLPHFDYLATDPTRVVSVLNSSTMVVCMIESPQGLDQVEEIAEVEGLDGLYVGMGDMLLSMGKPGDFESGDIWNALDHVAGAAERFGLTVGAGGAKSVEHQIEAIRRGARFLTLQNDGGLLVKAAVQEVASLRNALNREEL